MRVLLQQIDSGLYLQDVNSWSRRNVEAIDFLSSTAAIEFCLTHKISGVQLVLKFDEQRYEIVLPVLPQLSNPTAAKPSV
jgi:hypothetical protein